MQFEAITKSEQREDLDALLEWTDMGVAEGAGPPRNVSACDGATCGQPAPSPDGRRVAHVRAARWTPRARPAPAQRFPGRP